MPLPGHFSVEIYSLVPLDAGESFGNQRSHFAAFIKAEATTEFNRAIASAQDQAQFGWIAAFGGKAHPECGQINLLSSAITV